VLAFVFFLALILCLSVTIPAEDVPDTAYDRVIGALGCKEAEKITDRKLSFAIEIWSGECA
jgi:hypothetical protein